MIQVLLSFCGPQLTLQIDAVAVKKNWKPFREKSRENAVTSRGEKRYTAANNECIGALSAKQ